MVRVQRDVLRGLFKRKLVSVAPLAYFALGGVFLVLLIQKPNWWWLHGTIALGAIGLGISQAWQLGKKAEFKSHHYRLLWQQVLEKLDRFEKALREVNKNWDDELPVLSQRVQLTAESVYEALRRADAMQVELNKSEGQAAYTTVSAPTPYGGVSSDQKVQELYRIADKNVAEYRQRLDSIMAGIQRSEGQTAVFITMLDNLRVRLLGYRLMGKSAEIEHRRFLEMIGEAKFQLDAVDQALDEISFTTVMGDMEELVAPESPAIDVKEQRLSETPGVINEAGDTNEDQPLRDREP